MTVIAIWDLQDVTFSGTPFASSALADSGDIGSTFVIDPASTRVYADMGDGDADFQDGDIDQELSSSLTVNGGSYSAGSNIETEYSYVVRPVGGATDGSEDVVIYGVEVSAGMVGFASNGFLAPGVSYEIVAIDSNDPVIAYSSLFICFRTGSRIQTPDGLRVVDRLQAGDLVCTKDDGHLPVIWAKTSVVQGLGAAAPVRFGPRALARLGLDEALRTHARFLTVSPQHRVLTHDASGAEVLVPARAFVGWQDVEVAPDPMVSYRHILLEKHALVSSEGLFSETLNPGPASFRAMPLKSKMELLALRPQAVHQRAYVDARPSLGAGQWRRQQGLSANMKAATEMAKLGQCHAPAHEQ